MKPTDGEIPKNKKQISNAKLSPSHHRWILNFGIEHWSLFVIWDFGFGISSVGLFLSVGENIFLLKSKKPQWIDETIGWSNFKNEPSARHQ
jgi:hypothetical protein